MGKNSGAVFSNEKLGLRVYTTKYKGHDFTVVSKFDVAAILPILGKGRVVLERHYRQVLGRYVYEIPAGHIENWERPRDTALRELKEETGYTPSRISPMLKICVSPGLLRETVHLYLATGLKKGRSSLGRYELLSVKIVTYKKALEMIETNRIQDAKTIVALLYYSAFVR